MKMFRILTPITLVSGGILSLTSCGKPDVEPLIYFTKTFDKLTSKDLITSFTFNFDGSTYDPQQDATYNLYITDDIYFFTTYNSNLAYIGLELHTSTSLNLIMEAAVTVLMPLAGESFQLQNFFSWDMGTLTGTFTTHQKIKSVNLSAPSFLKYAVFSGFNWN